MNSFSVAQQIVSSITTGTIGVFAGLAARHWWEMRLLVATNDARFVRSRWSGEYVQDIDGNDIRTPITFELSSWWKRVRGKVSEEGIPRFRCSGGFYHTRHLTLHYWSIQPGVVRHGLIMLRLSDDAKRMSGYFVGHGPLNECLVHGPIELERATVP